MGPGGTADGLSQARDAFQRATEAFCQLLIASPDPTTPVPGSEWTVGDVAVHLALLTEAYTGFIQGETEPFVDVSDIAGGSLARTSAARLAAEPDRDIDALKDRLGDAARALLSAAEGRRGTEAVIWNGREIHLADMFGIGVSEYLVHGLDVARALSRPWTIEPDDARLVLEAVLPLLPLLVDRRATASVEATYDIRIRGGRRAVLRINHGEGTVDASNGPIDCHVSADPVAMLLVAFGRQSQWVPALTGKLVAWGRRPWLGLRLTRYLVSP